MAKRTGKRKKSGPPPTAPDVLAAFRIYALAIERECLSVYFSDDKQFTKSTALFGDLGKFVQYIRDTYRDGNPSRLTDCRPPAVDCGGFCDMPELCS
jgi:hypothetical protein